MEICAGREFVCMYGGECEIVGQRNSISQAAEVQCNCEQSETATDRYVGAYCHVKSTEFCTIDGSKTSSGAGYDAFCTNGGSCRRRVEDQAEG
jgi:hypothetical protein